MSSSNRIRLAIYKGATFRKRITWKTGTSAANAVAVNLTGYTAHLQVRSTVDSSTVLLDLTTENGGIVLGGSAGTIDIVIDETVTQGLTWDSAVYDILLTAGGGGDVTRLFGGTVTVAPAVTRSAP